MRVLVTGGAGFIGSHLCDAFIARGIEVYVADDLSAGRAGRLSENVDLRKGTILDAAWLTDLVTEIKPQLICHLAAQVDIRLSVASPAADAEVNVIGTVNVLEAARAADARVVFSSTGGAIYGTDAPVPAMESFPPRPESPYGMAKYCAERYIDVYNRLYGTRHAVLRFANVYGPRQSPSGEAGVVAIFTAQAVKRRPLTVYGDGKQTRDYIYVGDCVAAILAAADYGQAGTWNIGTGTEVSVVELAAVISRIIGEEAELKFMPSRKGEIERSALVTERAERDLGWRKAMPLDDGVKAVVNWFAAGAPDRA